MTDPGRSTWDGPCGHEGCELQVKARRIPAETPALEADPADVVAPSGEADPYQVIEVEGYDDADGTDDEPAEPPGSGSSQPPGGEPAEPEAAPPADDAEVPAASTGAELTHERGGFGFRGRRTARPDPHPAAGDDEVIPGLF